MNDSTFDCFFASSGEDAAVLSCFAFLTGFLALDGGALFAFGFAFFATAAVFAIGVESLVARSSRETESRVLSLDSAEST
jgi:hypothetical protein